MLRPLFGAVLVLTLPACQGQDPAAQPEGGDKKKVHETAMAELKQPIALVSIYLPHVKVPEKPEQYMPKRRPDLEKASVASANEIRHAANGAKQKLERGGSEATKDLVTVLGTVATSCAEATEPGQQDACVAAVKALDAVLDKSTAAATAAGASGKYPRVGPEAITDEAKKSAAPMLKTLGPGSVEADYLAKRKDTAVTSADLISACQAAQGEVDTMAKAFEKADEPIRLVAVTHKMSMDSQCNGLNGVEKLRGELAECKKTKKKAPECSNACGRVKALVEDGVPAAAFAGMGKEHEEACAEKK
jgi:hypothetical protein